MVGPGDRLVVAQLGAVAALGWPGRARWRLSRVVAVSAAAAVALGGTFAAWAAREHGSRLTPHVQPPDGAVLLVTGPYATSRHPIYAALALASAGAAVLRRRPEPLLAWVALVAVLDRKTRLEERLLLERFGDAYERYRSTTPRVVGRPRSPVPPARPRQPPGHDGTVAR
ncbi:hypothetical protein ICW40_05505 [Actinotalea ferrariae]|uniref:methyltransferase family protein n=1 Tax=Actinotalea ferrariae TaxID=1386098 RepID=UPI001C8CD926|nr:methyltransferase [Actinotalea ferrariae]MBX9244262.1 hypothetical protein [Actinotalea ferrariae]